MNHTGSQHDVLLGEVTVALAGTQYFEAMLEAGERVHFEREPDNAHDGHAIRVENDDFVQVGYLPRKTAAWLAPLLDRGAVYATGKVATTPEGAYGEPVVRVAVYTGPGSAEFLAGPRDPQTGAEALHRLVVDAYNTMHGWRKPGVIREAAQRLHALSRRDLLPETHLLLALLPGFADSLEAHADVGALNAARGALMGLSIGERRHFRNVTLFPLFVENGHERDYLLLGEALETGMAEVTEISDHGSVPEVLVRNRSGQALLLPEGEIITGAKQNRVINITILVAAHSELVVPVSCVEQGRWSAASAAFRATHYATPRVRARKCQRVWAQAAQAGVFHGDQGEVWEDVACELSSAHVRSRTSSLTDGFEAKQSTFQEYREHLTIPEDAAGVAVVCGNQVASLEFFDSPSAMQHVWPRLSEACFFPFVWDPKASKPASERVVRAFLRKVQDKLEVLTNTRGLGVSVGIHGGKLSGTGLCHDDRLLHLAAFPIDR